MEWNGMEWNGGEWNDMEWHGMEWNGMEWNVTIYCNNVMGCTRRHGKVRSSDILYCNVGMQVSMHGSKYVGTSVDM